MAVRHLLQWGTVAGAGFTLDQDACQGVPPAFVGVAGGLLDDDDGVPQPTPDLPDIHRSPALAVRHVEVPGHGGHWCLSVQTRGGWAGRSGMCQFLFADDGQDPGALWAWAAAWVAAEGRVPDDPGAPPPAPGRRAGPRPVEAALWDLYLARVAVPVDGEPDGVAAVIGALLGTVPHGVARGNVWATYLLRVPVGRRRGFVVGRWPADLRRTGLPADVDAWLTAAAGPDRAPVDAGRTGEALAAVAALAVDGAAGDLRDCADMREFVHAATRLLAVRVADVPRLVDRADPALADHRAVVEQWAAEDPDALIDRLLRRPNRWLRELLVGALLAAHRREPHRDLPAVHRIAPAGWLSELAELLRETHTKEELVDLLRADFTAPGAPLHERSARIDRRTFFEELGLHNHDGSRDDLYPVALADAVAEVAGGGRVLHTARRYLAESDDISVGVAELLGALSGPVEPDLARDLVMVADNALAARAVLRQAADHNGRFPGSAEDWFTDVAALVGDADLRLAVFDLGASRLGQDASAAFLAAAMRSYADTGMTGIWSTVALGLADKAAEAEDARRKLDQARAEADAHRERLTAELRDARAAHDALAKDYATAVAQQARLRTDLETARSKQTRLKTDHGTATAQRDRFRRDLDAERAAHTRLRSEHAATAAERDRLRRELDEARQQQETARFDLREPADARTREPDHPASAPPETPVEPDQPGRTTAEAEPLTRQGRRRAKRAERREGQWFSPLIKRNLGFFTALGVVAILLVLLTLAAVDFFEGWP